MKRGTAGTGGTQPGAGLGGVVIIITPPPGTPGSAVTDAAGKFSLPLTAANASASGQLSICGQAPVPLANQSVTGTVLPAGATSAADVTGVGVSVPGYKLRSSTGISVLTIGTFTQFYLGNLCSERGSGATSAPSCRDLAAQATGRRSRLEQRGRSRGATSAGQFRLTPPGARRQPKEPLSSGTTATRYFGTTSPPASGRHGLLLSQ